MINSNEASPSVTETVRALYQAIEYHGINWEASHFLSKVIAWLIDEDLSSGRNIDPFVKIDSCTFKVDPEDKFSRAFLYGYEHEAVLLEFCKALCGKSSTIWDIGASFGLYAVQLANHAGPNARVTAFEPGRKALELLRENVARNDLSDRIVVAGHAVGSTSNKATFYQMANSAMSGLSDSGRSAKSDTYDVTVRTMDDVWEEQGRPSLTLVKIDVEGHEYEVLAGGRNALSYSTDAVVIFELSDKNLSEEAVNSTADILLEFVDDGWHLLSPGPDNKLLPLNPNFADGLETVGDDTVIMVRADSKQEIAVKTTWNRISKKRLMYLREHLVPTSALPAMSRYIADLLDNINSVHSKKLENRASEISALTKSLASREKDVALLEDKVNRVKAALAEAQAESSALRSELAALRSELEKSRTAHEATKCELAEHATVTRQIDDYMNRSVIGRALSFAFPSLKQATTLADEGGKSGKERIASAIANLLPSTPKRGHFGTSLQDAFERLANHRLPVDHIISLGAGSGGDSVAIRRLYYPSASLLMVEAQSDHEASLKNICSENDNARYIICAATREDGTAQFLSSSPTGGAVTSGQERGTIEVPARSIDSLARQYGLDDNLFLKFDTHGVETDILDGSQDVLQKTSLIMMEVYNFKMNFVQNKNLTFNEMCTYLGERGFRCVDLCNPLFRPNDNVLWQMHMFFIRSDHPVFRSNGYSAPSPFND